MAPATVGSAPCADANMALAPQVIRGFLSALLLPVIVYLVNRYIASSIGT